jgi:hypothetical protein
VVWEEVTSCYPADWFNIGNAHILGQYCRHVVAARHVAELIERVIGYRDFDIRAYKALLETQAKETSLMCSVATKLRITPQSTLNHRGNQVPMMLNKPWES